MIMMMAFEEKEKKKSVIKDNSFIFIRYLHIKNYCTE